MTTQCPTSLEGRTASMLGRSARGRRLLCECSLLPRLSRALLLALLALSAGGSSGSATQPAESGRQAITPDADETAVNQILAALASKTYAERAAAFAALDKLGPEAVPLLAPHVNHPSPEVRLRLQAVVAKFGWMKQGLVVLRPEETWARYENSTCVVTVVKPDDARLRVGDVLVRVNNDPVASSADLTISFPFDGNRFSPAGRGARYLKTENTYSVLRDGQVVAIKANGVLTDFTATEWDTDKGGNDAIRAVTALRNERYVDAAHRFRQAIDDGMDSADLLTLAAIAAAATGDRVSAVAAYEQAMSRRGEWAFVQGPVAGPINLANLQLSCHTAWLLDKLEHQAQPTPQQRADAFAYLTGSGRNWQRAAELLPVPPVPPVDGHPSDPANAPQMLRRTAILRALYWLGQFEDLAKWPGEAPSLSQAAWDNPNLCRVLIHAGRAGDAADYAQAMIADIQRKRETIAPSHAQAAAAALSAALAAGQFRQALTLFDEIRKLTVAEGEMVFRNAYQTGLDRRSTADRMIRRLAGYLADRPTCTPAANLLLNLHVMTQSAEPIDWERVAVAAEPANTVHPARIIRELLRNDLEAAERLLARREQPLGRPLTDAVKLLRDQRRSGGAAADLQGVVFAFPVGRFGTAAVKCTGEIVLVDAAGKVRPTSGIDQELVPMLGDKVVAHPAGLVYLHHYQTCLLDEKTWTWQPAYLAGQLADWQWESPEAAMIIAALIRSHPAEGYGRRLVWEDRQVDRKTPAQANWATRRWVFWGLGGDIVIAAHAGLGKTVDLSAALAGELRRERPVRVYRPVRLSDRVLVFSEAGLWSLDAAGKLTRVKLPVDRDDVAVSVANWPSEDGKVYIGVSPQQGGQIVEYDVADGAVRLKAGLFCGVGPNDVLAHSTDWTCANDMGLPMYYAIEQLARAATTQPKGN